MGRNKLQRPPLEELYGCISEILIPPAILKDFDIFGVSQNKEKWTIELREKEGRIPSELSEFEDVMFDGYCNPKETLSYSFACKPVMLRIFRRRYKRSNKNEHFSNEYDFTLKGVKIVPELGFFLKDAD